MLVSDATQGTLRPSHEQCTYGSTAVSLRSLRQGIQTTRRTQAAPPGARGRNYAHLPIHLSCLHEGIPLAGGEILCLTLYPGHVHFFSTTVPGSGSFQLSDLAGLGYGLRLGGLGRVYHISFPHLKGKGSFYIAQYPVRWTAQSA